MEKSQSAFEYMLNYAWALIIILIIGFTLYQFGVFNPDRFTGFQVKGLSNFHISDASINESGALTLAFASKSQEYYSFSKIMFEINGINCQADYETNSIIDKSIAQIIIYPDNDCNLEGDYADIDIYFFYETIDKIKKTEPGQIRALIYKDYGFGQIEQTAFEVGNVTASTIAGTYAIIEWDSNEAGNASIKYGKTLGMEEGIKNESSQSAFHSLMISNLTPLSDYYFNITMCKIGCKIFGPYNFTTLYYEGFYQFNVSSEIEFNEGIYINTEFGSVKLSQNNMTGIYASKIFDAGMNASWENISWKQNGYYGRQLPGNKGFESGINGINMNGNILLLYMDEGSGQIMDYSGSNNHGNYSGNLYSQEGIINSAMGFNGVNDNIAIKSLGNLGGVSASFWFKTNKSGENQALISGAFDSYIIYLDSSGKIGSGTQNSIGVATNIGGWDDGKWHHAAIIKNSLNNYTIYVDGIDYSGGFSSAYKSTNAALIGASLPNIPFNGWMDEVAIFSRKLSAQEIINIYERGALRLNLSVKGCDDSSCLGVPWINAFDYSFVTNVGINKSRHFQFKFDFETINPNYSPMLYNATIKYKID